MKKNKETSASALNTKVCLVIGENVSSSLSPAIHNGAYAVLGMSDLFTYVAANVAAADLKAAIDGVRALNIRGVSCTIPHKQSIIQHLDVVDEEAAKIGAVNTVVRTENGLMGYNTDIDGVLGPLKRLVSLEGKKVALMGAGGAARAACYVLMREKAKVTVFNRTVEKAEQLARDFGSEVGGISTLDRIRNADIVINATSIGTKGKSEESPLPENFISSSQIIFDMVYMPPETELLKIAKKKGAKVVYGTEMLIYQALRQFQLFTGKQCSYEVMRGIIERVATPK